MDPILDSSLLDRSDKLFKIRKYNPTLHYSALAGALLSRNMSPKLIKDLPKLGWVVSRLEAFGLYSFVGAGFVRKVEGKYWMIDSYITNANVDPTERSLALDELTRHIIGQAKLSNINKLIGFTLDDHTLLRSFRHGFVEQQHKLISLDLTSGQED